MAFCPNCGSQVEGRFCAKCGSAVGVDTGGTVPPGPATPVQSTTVQSAGMTDNVAAALCYLLTWLTGILFLVLEPYNRNKTIRFHAFQAIFFGVAVTILYIVIGMLSAMLTFMGLFFFSFLHLILFLGFILVWGMLMYKAYNNEKFVLPIIGPLAEKQA
jgi:uncharacterized membrane protein